MPVQIRDHTYSGIAEQFPDIYKTDGEFLVEFIKSYYKHLDEKMDRDVPKLRDIDTTLSTFLIYYKKKYLADLPLDTVVDTRFIIKHIQDMYRRKGTQESLELMFRLFFDEEIEVFYPSTAILRPSDSIWGGDTYLEMLPVYTVDDYPIAKGMIIRGDLSLASAFVDEVLFVNFSGSLSPIIYLSNVTGTFSADDAILVVTVDANGNESLQNVGKLISGSISEVAVNPSSRVANQQVGDKVKFQSSLTGVEGEGRVTKTSQTETGSIDFSIIDGGFGYADPTSIVASNSIGISNQVLIVDNANTVSLKPGDTITAASSLTYTGSGDAGAVPYTIQGSAKVIKYQHPLLFVQSNTLADVQTFFSQGNSAFEKAFYNKFIPNSFVIPDEYQHYERVFDRLSRWNNSHTITDLDSDGDLDLTDYQLLFRYSNVTDTQVPVLAPSALDANSWQKFIVRVYELLSNFDIFPPLTTGTDPVVNGLVSGSQQGGTAVAFPAVQNPSFNIVRLRDGVDHSTENPTPTIAVKNFGTFNDSAKFNIGTLSNTETVSLITDQIGDFLNVQFDPNANQQGDAGEDYGMSGPGAENLDTTLADAFTSITVKIGTIDTLNVLSTGSNFQNDVETLLIHDNIAKFNKKDVILTFENVDFFLNAGDIITQQRTIPDIPINQANNITEAELEALGSVTTDLGYRTSSTVFELTPGTTIPYTAKAKFLKRVGNDFFFRPLSFHGFDPDINVSIGNISKAIFRSSVDEDSSPMGSNANIIGTASYQVGQIDEVSINKTGYRYNDSEIVDIINIDPASSFFNQTVATATLRTLGQGKTEGRWRSKTSFLSEKSKKIHDNNYYQEYSYDVSSIVDPEKYEPLIAETVGVAGTKLFSTPLINSNNTLSSNLDVEFKYFDQVEQQYVVVNADTTTSNLQTESGVNMTAQISVGTN